MEYDPVAPLALPLGPRSAGMRAQLAAEVPFLLSYFLVFGLTSLLALVCVKKELLALFLHVAV